jgi:hypothetical protein
MFAMFKKKKKKNETTTTKKNLIFSALSLLVFLGKAYTQGDTQMQGWYV